MTRLIVLALALVPAVVYAQTSPPPLETDTGSGARTTTTSTRRVTPGVETTETSGITSFTGPGGTVSRFPVQVTSSGVVFITTSTITLIPGTGRPTAPVIVQQNTNTPAQSGSSSNKGAIAGGVIGALAVIIAIVATLLWFRRRSPAHWKAKAGSWKPMGPKPPILPTDSQHDFNRGEDKPRLPEGFPAQPTTDETHRDNPFRDPVDAPLPALFIREHRQPVQDPFASSLESPTSPTRPTHRKAAPSGNPLLSNTFS